MPQLDILIVFSNLILVLIIIGSIIFIFFQIKIANIVFLFQNIYITRYLTDFLYNIIKHRQKERLINFGLNKFNQL